MNSKFKIAAIAAISTGIAAGAFIASAQSMSFTQNLKLGTTNNEVVSLQKYLNSRGYTVSTSGTGSAGMESAYFGAKTKAAVIKFQAANGLPATGNVFAMTRAILNSGSTNSGNTTTTTTSGSVSVSLAATQPNTVIVAGSARAKLADVVFSGNGTVTNIKLMRTGVSDNSTLTNVYLYDAATGARLTDAASALTDGTINFNNVSGIFTVSGSRTVSVLADIASVSGQSVGVNVVSYDTAGNATAAVTGVTGPVLAIGSANLATAFFSAVTPANTTINAGTVGTTVWSSTLNVGTRSTNFSSLTFKYVGSAPVDSLANVKLYVDGVQFANASSFGTNGYVTFFSATPLSLTTGTHTFDLRADVVKGSNRSFYVSIENAGDIALQDSQLMGANVTVKYLSTSGATISNQAAGTITINAGSLTISQNSAFVANTAVGGTTNQIIGSFKFYAYGEDVKVMNLPITVTGSGITPTTTAINNVTVYVNGGAVTSGVTATLGTPFTVNLGSNLIVPAGSSTVVEVRGDLVNSGNSNVTAGTLIASIGAGSSNAQGVYSSNLASTPSATGQTLSVSNGNVAFGATSGFTATNISKNQAGVKVGSFSLQAGSAEGINVTNISVLLSGSSTASVGYTNLRVTDGTQTIVPTATNNFSVNYNVAAGQTKVIEVYVDTLDAIANGQTIIASSTVTYRGLVSNTTNTVSATGPTMTNSIVTVGTPTIVGASTLGSRYIIGGQSVSNSVTFNVVATNGNAVINDLNFAASTTGIESATINGVTAANVGGSINFYGLNLNVTSGSTGFNIPVTVKYSSVSNNGGVASEASSTIRLTGMKYTAGGSVVSTTTLSVAANPMTLVASLPTVKKTSTGISLGVGTTTNAKIGTITVSADAAGDTTVFVLPYSVSASNVVVKANGTNVTTLSGVTVSATSTTFSTGYRISAGNTVTFDVYGDVANGGTSSSNYDVTLGAASAFTWSDVVDGKVTSATATKTGTLLTTYNQ